MVYTETEKQKLDNILQAFSGFDIVYSGKMGYVKLLVKLASEPPAIIATAEELMDDLCYEVISEAVFSSHNPSHRLTAEAEAEGRDRLMTIIRQMDRDEGYDLNYVDKYVQKFQEEYDSDE